MMHHHHVIMPFAVVAIHGQLVGWTRRSVGAPTPREDLHLGMVSCC